MYVIRTKISWKQNIFKQHGKTYWNSPAWTLGTCWGRNFMGWGIIMSWNCHLILWEVMKLWFSRHKLFMFSYKNNMYNLHLISVIFQYDQNFQCLTSHGTIFFPYITFWANRCTYILTGSKTFAPWTSPPGQLPLDISPLTIFPGYYPPHTPIP